MVIFRDKKGEIMKLLIKPIIYNEKVVLKESSIEIINAKLNVVSGESGCGKSTLFKYIIAHKNEAGIKHIAACTQEPDFLDGLTVREHIQLLESLYGKKKYRKHAVKLLGLNECMERFPQQLSGGEQKRAGFLLSILENADLYMFDEPTASVNREYTENFISLLEYLKKEGKTIVIFTHDQNLMDSADVWYRIENSSIVQQKCAQAGRNLPCSEGYEPDTSKLSKYLIKINKRNKSLIKITDAVLSVLCAAAGILYATGISAYKSQQAALGNIVSNEIVVFKEGNCTYVDDNVQYNYDNQSPFSDEEVEKLNGIANVEAVEWRYDIVETDVFNRDITDSAGAGSQYFMNHFKIEDHSGNCAETDIEEVITSTYLPDYLQASDISESTGEEGVYVSASLYKRLAEQAGSVMDDYGNVTVTTEISIPLYNCYGRVMTGVGDDIAYDYSTVVTRKEISFKIAGILKESSFGIPDYHENVIYYPRSVVEQLIRENVRDADRVVYAIGEDWSQYYIDDLPEDFSGEVNRTMYETVWKPSAYSVYVNGIENMNEVMEKIKDCGFAVISEKSSMSGYQSFIHSVIRIYAAGTAAVCVLAVLTGAIIQFLLKKKKINNMEYFRRIGIPSSALNHAMRMSAIRDTILVSIFAEAAAGIWCCYRLARYGVLLFTPVSGLLIVLLCVMTKYVIPEICVMKLK